MTAKELFWNRVQQRSADLEGPVRNALLKVFRNIRDRVDEGTLKALLSRGAVDEIIAVALSDRKLNNDLLPLDRSLKRTIEQGFEKSIRDLPRAGRIGGDVLVEFNTRTAAVKDAVETVITSPAIENIKSSVRELVRGIIHEGLDSGRTSGEMVADIKQLIGLGPDQLKQVQNFRRALMGEKGIEDFTLRDHRIDALLEKRSLSPAEVERFTAKYMERRIASNAATITRTITLSAYKTGQNLTWQEAQETPLIPEGFHLEKQWVQIDRPTAREDHIEMNGEQVPFDEEYSNGSMIPGDQGEYNCGCVSLVTVVRD